VDEQFKASTVGLVTAEDFKRKRVELEQAAKEAEAAKLKAQEKERKKKGKERQQQMKSLSFAVDDEEEAFVPPPPPKRKEAPTAADGTGAAAAAATDASTAAAASAPSVVAALSSSSSSAQPSKKLKLSNKDPTADTSFLPDRERELEEAALRAKLESEWKAQQEETKKENIQIVFSYWDGSGHRNKVVVNKGATIGQFLEKARKGMCVHLHTRAWSPCAGWLGGSARCCLVQSLMCSRVRIVPSVCLCLSVFSLAVWTSSTSFAVLAATV